MVEDGAFSHKMDYVTIFEEILNIKGHPNHITGSQVTKILLNGWILPIGGASAVKGLRLQPAKQACWSTFEYLTAYCQVLTCISLQRLASGTWAGTGRLGETRNTGPWATGSSISTGCHLHWSMDLKLLAKRPFSP